MVSQCGSIGYTIMGKTAGLTVLQKTVIDTLNKEGNPQKSIAKEAGCSQSAVSKHINGTLCGRKNCGRKSKRNNCSLERIVKHSPLKNLSWPKINWLFGWIGSLSFAQFSCLSNVVVLCMTITWCWLNFVINIVSSNGCWLHCLTLAGPIWFCQSKSTVFPSNLDAIIKSAIVINYLRNN